MAYKIDTANGGHTDLLRHIRRYLLGCAEWSTPTYTGTGDGTLDDLDSEPASIAETWTITCTDATTAGAEVWSVVGSVSGTQATATTAVPYKNTYLEFTITAGATDFVTTDNWSIVMTAGPLATLGEEWSENEWDYDGTLESLFVHLQAPGLTGTEEIFISMGSYENTTSDIFNLKFSAATGYLSGKDADFSQQPGSSPVRGMPAWDSSIPYWLIVNEQRFILVAKIETVYVVAYMGKGLPYGSVGQYPYPVISATMLTDDAETRYSDTGYNSPFQEDGTIHIRFIDGVWKEAQVWPDSSGELETLRDTGGDYPLLPIVLWQKEFNQYCELDGVFAVSGFSNSVENTITEGADTFLVVHNVWRTGFNDYVAIKLA